MNIDGSSNDDIMVQIIDYDEVPDSLFPFFTSYRIQFDPYIRCYGFFQASDLVAVAAVIPEESDFKGGFQSVGCPIIYVFEVRTDLQQKGLGTKCARILVNSTLSDNTIQLCCISSIVPFWSKIGFEVKSIDQTFNFNRMMLRKEENSVKD